MSTTTTTNTRRSTKETVLERLGETSVSQQLTRDDSNVDPKPTTGSKKRDRSSLSPSSSSTTIAAAATTTATTTSAVGNLPKRQKKERKPRPSAEEVSKANATHPALRPEFKAKMVTELGITDEPILICQKFVFGSDTSAQQARLLIPLQQLIRKEDEFLGEAEWRALNQGEGQIRVKVINPRVRAEDDEVVGVAEKEMTLSRWPKPETVRKEKEEKREKKTSIRYALQGGWNAVKDEIDVKEGDVIQVWAFSYGGAEKKLALALVNLGHFQTITGLPYTQS